MGLFVKKNENLENLEKEINSVLKEMEDRPKEDTDYTLICTNLKNLFEAKSYEKDFVVNKTAVITSVLALVTSIGGVCLILNYEKMDVVVSKALSLVKKV